MKIGEPSRMKTHYADTIDFDWASHFVRQADSGLNVRQYCKLNQCSRTTWYRVKQQYFKHTKKRTGIEPLLSSSGEKAVDSQLSRTVSGTVNTGMINETGVCLTSMVWSQRHQVNHTLLK